MTTVRRWKAKAEENKKYKLKTKKAIAKRIWIVSYLQFNKNREEACTKKNSYITEWAISI